MKAVFFNKTGSTANLQVQNVAAPGKLKAGEVRLKFLAGSLNHLDLWVLKGLPRVKYLFPHVCGADLCGEVLESKSNKFKLKEKVILYPGDSAGKDLNGNAAPENLCSDFRIRGENSPGVFAEEVIASDRFILKMPKHLSIEEAASLPLVYLTAWQMVVEKAELISGKVRDLPVLVHAAGSGVSQAILEILYSFGAKKVAVTSRSEAKLADWRKKGFAGFVLGTNTFDEIKTWAGSARVAVIFDHTGADLFEMNIRLLRNAGSYITCGATSGFDAKLDLRQLYFRQLKLLGSTMGSLKHFHEAIRWIEKKKIRPTISQVLPFDQVRQAYELMESGQQSGKIVLKA